MAQKPRISPAMKSKPWAQGLEVGETRDWKSAQAMYQVCLFVCVCVCVQVFARRSAKAEDNLACSQKLPTFFIETGSLEHAG